MIGHVRFEMSPFLIIPAAFVFLSYLQHVHDKASSGLALGIVQDPKVRGAVLYTAGRNLQYVIFVSDLLRRVF